MCKKSQITHFTCIW